MIPRKTVDEVTQMANSHIVDIVSGYVSLRKRGASYVGCCPFHNEKTPSFYVSPAKEMFNCFGCHKGGSVITFIMEIEKISYPDAIRLLGRRFGITVEDEIADPAMQAAAKAAAAERDAVSSALEYAARLFESQLRNSPDGQNSALAHLRESGLRDDTIATFRLGFALPPQNAFLNKALADGFKKEFLLKAGLITPSPDPNTDAESDLFTNAITFPLQNGTGKIVGFLAKNLSPSDAALPQYARTPDSQFFSATTNLYGIYQARTEMSRTAKCFIVESLTDVLFFHQAGIINTLAPITDELTLPQIKSIARFAKDVTLAFDADQAAVFATLSNINNLLREGLNVHVLLLPSGQSPEDFAKLSPQDELHNYIETQESDFVLFKADFLYAMADDDVSRSAALDSIVETIACVQDVILQDIYISDCAVRLHTSPDALAAAVAARQTP